MSAAKHIHPGQLGMLYPAGHLADPEKVDSYHALYDPGATHESVRAKKINEAKTGPEHDSWVMSRKAMEEGRTLRDSIAQKGVREPVTLIHPERSRPGGRPMLEEGHHRVFTAHDLDPRMEVPVRWSK
jgi:hypothetical protein